MCDSLCRCNIFLICQENDGAPANGLQKKCKVSLSQAFGSLPTKWNFLHCKMGSMGSMCQQITCVTVLKTTHFSVLLATDTLDSNQQVSYCPFSPNDAHLPVPSPNCQAYQQSHLDTPSASGCVQRWGTPHCFLHQRFQNLVGFHGVPSFGHPRKSCTWHRFWPPDFRKTLTWKKLREENGAVVSELFH